MKNLHIINSYKVWKPFLMKIKITSTAYNAYGVIQEDEVVALLNRSMTSLIIEWWLHNIGYYLTKPLCAIPYFKALNKRFKDVDLEERRR